ncbi:MAG: HAMP domain-containing protein [Acidobacteria bacterium]|nr:HAMP domain-containing protein [Acidobacteriota bacterium]
MNFRRLPLLARIWMPAGLVITFLFLATGFFIERNVVASTTATLEGEVRASFDAYESLWNARAQTLQSVAGVMSSLPNVRAAFGVRDAATIRDAASEVLGKISEQVLGSSFFTVTDPTGRFVASLTPTEEMDWPVVAGLHARFPNQVSGFVRAHGGLFQLIVTPVYVDSGQGTALISVLLAGFKVDDAVAQRLKASTGGSEFLFVSGGRVDASSMPPDVSRALAGELPQGLARAGAVEYVPLVQDLVDLEGKPIGALRVFRSLEHSKLRVSAMLQDLAWIWAVAMLAGLVLTYFFARIIIRPVRRLEQAATEVARQNYHSTVPVESEDELGRLAAAFNRMCDSLQLARRELIRQERITTIGRMASSIVHDLRNPLAAVYGGAEMMVDSDLAPNQVKRLAGNIYRASRRIQELLQDLVNVAGGKSAGRELCCLDEIVRAATEAVAAEAEAGQVRIEADVPPQLEVSVERARVERVFENLLHNAIEAMPNGGRTVITARLEGDQVVAEVRDNGPGISPAIRDQLFQPFATTGKKNGLGLGLGLALSRQTLLDHGGELWAEPLQSPGACFRLRLPLQLQPDHQSREPRTQQA